MLRSTFCLIFLVISFVDNHPVRHSRFTDSVEEEIANNTNIIVKKVEMIVQERMGKLLDRVYSLSRVAEALLNNTKDIKLETTYGTAEDLSARCRIGFRSTPGIHKCYYFSNYKRTWEQAKEKCHQFGDGVDPVSLGTTRKQFAVSHLISSDPVLRTYRKWWTGGRSYGRSYFDNKWYWYSRMDYTEVFGKYWADNRKSPEANFNQCIYLDATYHYQWRNTSCPIGGGPSFHFICEHEPFSSLRNSRRPPRNFVQASPGVARITALVDRLTTSSGEAEVHQPEARVDSIGIVLDGPSWLNSVGNDTVVL